MKKNVSLFTTSLQEFSNLRNVIFCALMAGIAIVLNSLVSIDIGPYIRIGFSGIPNRVVEYLFGPAIGSLFGGALDILKYFLKPNGTFFPGFTFNVMLAGIIYGYFLYKKPISIFRIFIAEFLVKAIVNCFLNTLWLSFINGKAFFAILPIRIIRNIIMLPIDSIILFIILTFIAKTIKPMFQTNS